MSELALMYLEGERRWRSVAERYLGPDPELLAVSRWIPDSRVYASGRRVAIIRSRGTVVPRHVAGLRHESSVLGRLGRPHEYVEDDGWHVLMTTRYTGRTLEQMAPHLSIRSRTKLLARVVPALRALHRAGVAHRDLRLDNILFTDEGDVRLIDFDRAVLASPREAAVSDWVGVSSRGVSYYPFWKLAAYFLVPKSGTAARRSAAWLRRIIKRPSRARSEASAQLSTAWQIAAASNANAPGHREAYYSMTIGGVLLRGERPWALRWEAIRRAVDFRGKRVLELGCNLGLFSSFALLEGAESACGVDSDPSILEGARLAARALGVAPDFERVDLAKDAYWEERLEGRDVVVAMSVVHWLPNPDRVFSFLARHPMVIYEGHDDLATESRRLHEAGFSQVDVLLESERGRHVLLGRKRKPASFAAKA